MTSARMCKICSTQISEEEGGMCAACSSKLSSLEEWVGEEVELIGRMNSKGLVVGAKPPDIVEVKQRDSVFGTVVEYRVGFVRKVPR